MSRVIDFNRFLLTDGMSRCVAGAGVSVDRSKGEFLMSDLIKRFVKEEEGATMVEYGLMVALIAVVCIAAVTLIGTNLAAKFGAVNTAVN